MKTISMIMVISLFVVGLVFFGVWSDRFTNGTMNGSVEISWEPFIMFVLFLIGLGVGTLIYKVIKKK